MTIYNYKAVDQAGRVTRAQMDAVNEVDLEVRLERMGLDLITFSLASKRLSLASQRVKNRDLVMFCFQLEQLTSTGVPLLEGLTDLRDSTTNPYFAKVIGALVADVEGGKMLSEAMADHVGVFGDVFVSLVHAGEQSGELPKVFNNLSNTLNWQDELLAQTKRLMLYPFILLLVVSGAIVTLMVYLVPEMVKFLKTLGQELPWNTKLLIASSNMIMNYWWIILLVVVVTSFLVAIILTSSERARYWFDYLKLKLPLTGNILHKIIMARFARYFALMYETGIPILDAIKSCEKIVGNRVIAESLSRVYGQVNAGDRMSESFHNTGLFSPLVVRMIKIGETTGALDKSLMNVSYFYDRDVDDMMQKMLRLLEPALTVILGLIILFIMASVLLPVYDSFSVMKL